MHPRHAPSRPQRGPDGAIMGVNRRLPPLQRLALEYGKGLVELVIAKKREIARFAAPGGPQQPSAVSVVCLFCLFFSWHTYTHTLSSPSTAIACFPSVCRSANPPARIPPKQQILWQDGRELPLAEAMGRVLALFPRSPHCHPAAYANGHRPLGPPAAISSSAIAPPQPHSRTTSSSSSSASSSLPNGAFLPPAPDAAAGHYSGSGSGNGHGSSSNGGAAPLLIMTREMESAFQGWLRENTTTKLAAIQTAGGAVDGFLARVAAAALVAAAAAAGVEDVAPDELPLPRIATYDELKTFIEAHVAQCERCVRLWCVCVLVVVCVGEGAICVLTFDVINLQGGVQRHQVPAEALVLLPRLPGLRRRHRPAAAAATPAAAGRGKAGATTTVGPVVLLILLAAGVSGRRWGEWRRQRWGALPPCLPTTTSTRRRPAGAGAGIPTIPTTITSRRRRSSSSTINTTRAPPPSLPTRAGRGPSPSPPPRAASAAGAGAAAGGGRAASWTRTRGRGSWTG